MGFTMDHLRLALVNAHIVQQSEGKNLCENEFK